MTGPENRVLETVTGPELLGKIHRALDLCWAQHGNIPARIRTAVATGSAEIGANIVQHASGGRPVPIRMDIEVLPHQVKVVFSDQGEPATVDLAAVRIPDALAKRGRGLALAMAVLDGLYYRRRGNHNQWTLISRNFG
jgi:serine/threonine-protein kinase RsbW